MLAARLTKISNHFKESINISPKAKILLTHKNLVVLNQALLCSTNQNTAKIFKKSFSAQEIYYRQYLLNNAEYRNLIFHEGMKSNSTTAAILEKLHPKGENNPKAKDQLSDYLDQELNQFTFSELCEVIFLIAKFMQQNGVEPSWNKILQNINEQCLIRLSRWRVDELIKVIDLSMMLPVPLKFKNKLLYKLIKKSSENHEIVFLFYFFMRRKFSVPKEHLFDLHLRTNQILPEINSTEAGIIAQGFHNSFECLQKPDMLYNILKKAIEDMENIDEVPFQSFCKFAQIMSNFYYYKGVPEFQKGAIKTALRFGTKTLILLARSGEKVRYIDSDLRTVLMREVKDHISELSLLYIERVAYITTIFNIHDEEFLKLALDAVKTEELGENNRLSLLLLLKHFIHYKIYPKNLLGLVLRQEFVDNLRACGMNSLSAWWFIYCSLEVEQPEYLTFDLTPKTRNKIYQVNKFTFYSIYPKHHSFLGRIKSILTEQFGQGTVQYLMPLPHYPVGLLMRFDKNSKPQILPEDFVTFNKSHTIKPLKDDHIWLFIIWVHHSHLADISDSISTFVFQTQLRQLNAIGYTVLPIFKIYNFRNISNKNSQLEEYFENLVNAKLEECCKDQKGAVIN